MTGDRCQMKQDLWLILFLVIFIFFGWKTTQQKNVYYCHHWHMPRYSVSPVCRIYHLQYKLEDTARYDGLLLAPAEGFGLWPRFLLPSVQKKSFLCYFAVQIKCATFLVAQKNSLTFLKKRVILMQDLIATTSRKSNFVHK